MSTLASVIMEGTAASKPAASIPGRLYFTTDTLQIFYDTGSAWTNVTPASSGAASATIEHVFTAAGTYNFAHNLDCLNPLVTVYVVSGSSQYSMKPVDTNTMAVTVSGAADLIVTFVQTETNPGTFAFTIPEATTYVPTMSGAQTVNLPVAQTMYSGYAATEAYTTTGEASGITSSALSLTNTATGNLTLTFPATQAPGTSSMTVSATDGTQTYTSPASLTITDINQGLLDGWQMNEGSGTTFNDATSNANTQTFASSIGTWGAVTGFPGTAFTFNGTGESTGTNQTLTDFTGTTPFSVSVWVKPSSVTAQSSLVTTLDTANSFIGWELGIGADGSVTGFLINTYPSNAIEVHSASSLSANTLYHLVITYNGGQKAADVQFYVNGSSWANNTPVYDTLTATIANTKTVSLGARGNATQPLTGPMGYVRIYNRVLSAADVSAMYAAGPR